MTKNGYEILATFPLIKYTIIDRHIDRKCCGRYVCAWCYDEETDTWAQGHYMDNFTSAFAYIWDKYHEIGETEQISHDERIFI